MAEDQVGKADFLRNLFMFDKLTDSQIETLASHATVRSFNRGNIIYSQGDPATHFYILWAGKARLITSRGKDLPKKNLALLIYGDFFGEDSFSVAKRLDSAVALESTDVFEIDRNDLVALFDQAPEFKKMVVATADSRQLVRQRQFAWLGDEEAVYLVNRRHEVFLVLRSILPILLGLVSLALLAFSAAAKNSILAAFSLGLGVLTLAWLVWTYFDWENDYYIVTSQRVMWREKIILLYESRHEAPLDAVLSTKKVYNPSLYRLFKYATVIVNTYTGSIAMKRSQRPDLFILYVDGLKVRSHEVSKQISDQAMESAIRRRLGMPIDQEEGEHIPGSPQAKSRQKEQSPSFWKDFSKFFYMRFAEGNQITYRKHWIVLMRKTILPLLIDLSLLFLAGFLWAKGILHGTVAIVIWMPFFIGVSLWWLYRLIDWHNDLYILTSDTIIDIDQKPFIRTERRVAKLENILSLEHAREGFLGMMLNYGTVTINIGAEKFLFQKVSNPVEVQYEIFDRMNEVRRHKQEDEAINERDRVANWLAIFTKQLEELEDLEKKPKEDEVSE